MRGSNNSVNHIEDRSGDPKYYVRYPRLVWALARDPFDLAFYYIVKDIAGENGECWLSSSKLADLAGMSMGKVDDCRAYWIEQGMLWGEVQQDAGYRPVWHLKVINIWEQNIRWSEAHPSIDSRLAFKRARRTKKRIGRQCPRCQRSFAASGRRQRLCPDCQKIASMEADAILQMVHSPLKQLLLAGSACAVCGLKDRLTLHLDEAQQSLVILCENHHDALHPTFHGMKGEENRVDLSCHERSYAPHERLYSPHERKNNHKNNQKKKHKNPSQLWEEIKPIFQQRLPLSEQARWLNRVIPISLTHDVLTLGIVNGAGVSWLNKHKAILQTCLQHVDPTYQVVFTLITF